MRIAAGKKRDLVTLPDQLFGQVRDHPLRAAVKERRNAFIERGNLRDAHENRLARSVRNATRADDPDSTSVASGLAIRLPRPSIERLFWIELVRSSLKEAASCRDSPQAGMPSKE